MSLLPTAHAGQAFGARRIDFFTVSGEVARSEGTTGHVRDDDGMDHDIRLQEQTSALAPGDNVTILRVQAGPNRRSRPVAIVNHSRETWLRAAPDATTLLARTGITRGFNWWLAVLLLGLTALASVWPLLHAFLTEMNGGMMAGVPAFSVLDEVAAYAPALSGWRLEAALPTGLLDAIAGLGVVPMDRLTEWGLAVGGAGLALIAYLARSWRLLYVPVYAGFAIMAGVILGGPEATLALVGGAVGLFLAGGLFNRVRDAGRFNARVERLAEHVLRNPPQEGVRSNDAAPVAAAAATGTAAAAALADTGAGDAETAAGAGEDAPEAADPSEDAANGEAEAGPEMELPPATAAAAVEATAAASARPDEAGEAEAASLEADEADEAAPADAAAAETEEDVEVTATSDAGETGDAPEADAAAPADDEASVDTIENADTAASDAPEIVEITALETVQPEATAEAGTEETASDAGDDEDDLPSLDDVAAAAALNAAEQAGDDATSETDGNPDAEAASETRSDTGDALEDERTMPLASPPPMPAAGETEPDAGEGSEAAASAETPEAAETPDPAAATDDAGDTAGATETTNPANSPALGEVEDRVAAAVEAAGAATPAVQTPVDDPLMDDAGPDPMLPKQQAGDTAPGAPDLDIEPEDTETTAS